MDAENAVAWRKVWPDGTTDAWRLMPVPTTPLEDVKRGWHTIEYAYYRPTPPAMDAEQREKMARELLAKEAGVTLSTVDLWKSGHSSVTAATALRAIVRALAQPVTEGWRQATIAEAARLLQVWLDEGECDCDGPHTCGRHHVQRIVADLKALAAAPEPEGR